MILPTATRRRRRAPRRKRRLELRLFFVVRLVRHPVKREPRHRHGRRLLETPLLFPSHGSPSLEIAQKPANYKEGDVLETWKYTSHIIHSNNELDSNGNVVKGGTVQSIVSQTPVKETMTLQTKTDKNGSSYLALR